jgi:hypothetical protein
MKTEIAKDFKVEMIEKFQCPGCVCGSDVSYENFNMDARISGEFKCKGHVAGTTMMYPGVGLRKVYLGFPTGFNKGEAEIWMYENPKDHYSFDRCNIPFWAMEEEDYLFIRTYQPRLNKGCVEVVKGGKMSEVCPTAENVATFINEID